MKRVIDDTESRLKLLTRKRLMDPNIATETNDKMGRGWTIRRAYDDVGLRCDLANDEINAGIQNVMELLKPDARTRKPRFRAFNTCQRFIYGMTHWSWDEWTRQGDREVKEKPLGAGPLRPPAGFPPKGRIWVDSPRITGSLAQVTPIRCIITV